MNNIKNITGIIEEKLLKVDKNDKNYLLLKLKNGDTIFVFPSKIDTGKWDNLEENKQEYNFTVEEGNNGSNLLIDFEIET